MLEQIEKSEHRIYRILSDDAGIPEEEMEPAERTGHEETPGALSPAPRQRD